MLAAARDNPDYLHSPTIDFINLTARHRLILRKIVAVAGDHPDPMYDSYYNPDVAHYNITHTPTMLVTGTRDIYPAGEVLYSAWRNFGLMPHLTNRVFLNVAEATHFQPVLSHSETKYIAYFTQFHVMGNATAGAMIYGNDVLDGSLLDLWMRGKVVAGMGARNNGGSWGEVSFLACGGKVGNVPVRFGKYCYLGMDGVDEHIQTISSIGDRVESVYYCICILLGIILLSWLIMKRGLKRCSKKRDSDKD